MFKADLDGMHHQEQINDYIREAEMDHALNEKRHNRPGLFSHVNGLLSRLAVALKGHGTSKHKHMPNRKLRGHPRPL